MNGLHNFTKKNTLSGTGRKVGCGVGVLYQGRRDDWKAASGTPSRTLVDRRARRKVGNVSWRHKCVGMLVGGCGGSGETQVWELAKFSTSTMAWLSICISALRYRILLCMLHNKENADIFQLWSLLEASFFHNTVLHLTYNGHLEGSGYRKWLNRSSSRVNHLGHSQNWQTCNRTSAIFELIIL